MAGSQFDTPPSAVDQTSYPGLQLHELTGNERVNITKENVTNVLHHAVEFHPWTDFDNTADTIPQAVRGIYRGRTCNDTY